MRFLTITLVSALAALASAQGLSSLPTCAQTCVGTSLGSTGCQGLDIACICKSNGWISGLSCCIATGCSAADQATTIQFADQICAAAGVTLPSTASCASSSAPMTSSVPSSTMMASTTVAVAGVSTTGMSSSMAGVPSSTMSSSGSMSATTMAASGSMSATTMAASGSTMPAAASPASSASAVSTAGAAHNVGQGMGVAGAVVAALAML